MDILAKSWQFSWVYRHGKRINCKRLVVYYYPREGRDEQGPSFGFVASKRVGNAVKRNRAKRLMREACRKISKHLIHRDFWMVVVAKSSFSSSKYQEILMDLKQTLQSEGILHEIIDI